MTRLVLKAHNLVLKARAVARTNALNSACIKRRTVDVFKNNLLGVVIRPAYVAVNLVFTEVLGFVGKRLWRLVALLNFKLGEIN